VCAVFERINRFGNDGHTHSECALFRCILSIGLFHYGQIKPGHRVLITGDSTIYLLATLSIVNELSIMLHIHEPYDVIDLSLRMY